ncbi:MAG: phosphonate metabolism transcriptional regulator PhnF [Candidatus Aquicultor sp.]|nr:phosphonate metabolism transcriptional regulator PhnF [Candidatus Aquicultor sp.]
MFIDKENGIPYYRQLIEILQKQIREGAYKEGDKLPSEAELSLIFKINRHTVRQAVNELVLCGILYKLRGKGTFVARKKADHIDYKVSKKTSFTQNILEVGLKPSARLSKAVVVPAPESVAQNLGIGQGERTFFLEIARFANDEVISLSTTYLPEYLAPDLNKNLKRFSSLYKVLEDHYDLVPTRTKSVFNATFPSMDDALRLGISRDTPILKVESVMRTTGGTIVEYSVTRFRSDRAKISVDFT